MKLIVQIPCYNEEKTIKEMIESIPGQIAGIDSIETIIIDDGSTDATVKRAAETGCKIISLPRHKGLAAAFSAGIEAAIEMGADILVNTDADFQYPSNFIPALIKPIQDGTADMTIGNRFSNGNKPFSPIKMFFQDFGSRVVRLFSGVKVSDAASGFRAFSRDAMKKIVIHDDFSYTLESIFLAGVNHFRVENVPITTNPHTRESRLFKGIGQYIKRSAITVIRISLMYHPLRFFTAIGSVFLSGALALGVRFLFYYFQDGGRGHVQSLILLVVLTIIGIQSIIVGLLADVVAANRRLLEYIRIRQMESK
jgi:glycosyltransferase involved in cell wall biosynthesis